MSLSEALGNSLRVHYNSEPAGIDYLSYIRDVLSPDVCALCGSLITSSNDHFLPREDYPEFSFFSLNLIPACPCNTDKGRTFKGNAGEWFLHPYFDSSLRDRLIRASFSGSFETPTIKLVPVSGLSSSVKVRVQFQITEIIEKNNVYNWLGKRWTRLVQVPGEMLGVSAASAFTEADVRDAVLRRLSMHDSEAGTPNNWNSFLFSGVAHGRSVISRLVRRLRGQPASAIAALN